MKNKRSRVGQYTKTLTALVFAFTVLVPTLLFAQTSATKEYRYASINVAIHVNKDTTLDIEERQTFTYQGNFHAATRDIPLEKISAITDVMVLDGATSQALEYSSARLDKLDSSSWGKFTTWTSGGIVHAEWYYNLADTTHEWIIRYKVHGAIEFRKDYDRLYWNIFSSNPGYTVPVDAVNVSVSLPEKIAASSTKLAGYRTRSWMPIVQSFSNDNQVFTFQSADFLPGESFTIDVGWPKGLVDQNAFWWDFFSLYYGYILSVVVIISGVLTVFLYWLFRERLKENRRAIIPEYEPPENLRPAIAEVVLKEQVSDKGLAATIVDLAVRGYITIEEKRSAWGKVAQYILSFIAIVPALILLFIAYFTYRTDIALFWGIIIVAAIAFAFRIIRVLFSDSQATSSFGIDYILHKGKKYEDNSDIEPYERAYIGALFAGYDDFSTKEIRSLTNQTRQRELVLAIEDVKKLVYQNQVLDKSFGVDVEKQKKKQGIMWLIFFICAGIAVGFTVSNAFGQLPILFATLVATTFAAWSFIRYHLRLTKEGQLLKDEWLGFKMFLEVTDKHRVQNLTPDMFQKYLPYAIIFGVEKKWAKAFDGMNVPQPNWYASSTVVYGAGGVPSSGTPSFSPSAFSASFASSFSSAFASSAGGGGGGVGGGGAGGGGGGGGGGAS